MFDVNLNFVEQIDFLEIFCYFGGIGLSEKCVNVSCCVVVYQKKRKDQKPNQADPLQVKENKNKTITTCEGQNDHNKNQYCQSKNTK